MTLSPSDIRELLDEYDQNLAENGLAGERGEITEEILEALPELLDEYEGLERTVAQLERLLGNNAAPMKECVDLSLTQRITELEREANKREDMYLEMLRARNAMTYEAEEKAERLQTELNEWKGYVQQAMEGECGNEDEVHCSCYPILKKANAELQKEVERLSDDDLTFAVACGECGHEAVISATRGSSVQLEWDALCAQVKFLKEKNEHGDYSYDSAVKEMNGLYNETIPALEAERGELQEEVERLKEYLSSTDAAWFEKYEALRVTYESASAVIVRALAPIRTYLRMSDEDGFPEECALKRTALILSEHKLSEPGEECTCGEVAGCWPSEADARPQRGGWAPGNYRNTCVHCALKFVGDKRAVSCAKCAYDSPETK